MNINKNEYQHQCCRSAPYTYFKKKMWTDHEYHSSNLKEKAHEWQDLNEMCDLKFTVWNNFLHNLWWDLFTFFFSSLLWRLTKLTTEIYKSISKAQLCCGGIKRNLKICYPDILLLEHQWRFKEVLFLYLSLGYWGTIFIQYQYTLTEKSLMKGKRRIRHENLIVEKFTV